MMVAGIGSHKDVLPGCLTDGRLGPGRSAAGFGRVAIDGSATADDP